MIEAVDCLSAAHSQRRLFLILATGLKWMPIFWNPVGPAGTPLHILKNNRRDTWAVDPCIHIITTASSSMHKTGTPSQHIHLTSGR